MQLASALSERYATRIIDGNVDRDFVQTTCQALQAGDVSAIGISVMGGAQLPAALAVSRAIREVAPQVPIIWGSYFPTLCPEAALASPCVDYVVRGQGEATIRELLAALESGADLQDIAGLSWRRGDEIVNNHDRGFSPASPELDLSVVDDPARYFSPTYLGRRTTGYQAALGCRYRCNFCGVAAMFRGKTSLPPAERVLRDLTLLRERFGVDSVNFYDHNFFDREVDMQPLLQTLAQLQMPWWCFARADALLGLSETSWALVRKSRLRMAYIGAESPNDATLKSMRKGTQADQTLAVVDLCRRQGVVPELSFMLAPPHDPIGETERTFEFIRQIKRLHPATEIMLYIHTPLPPQRGLRRDPAAEGIAFPTTAEGWAAPEWVRYWGHMDAPWLDERLRQRIEDFRLVLGSRFPTITDWRAPAWQKQALSGLAAWRYRLGRYDKPWELALMRRVVRLWEPQLSGL
ncbi:B12-binding domain-containing radical SAM protein [Burkholderiaceae bacterium UC74_6]